MPVTIAFLSNISLTIFIFLIADIEVVAIDILGWLYISIFAF